MYRHMLIFQYKNKFINIMINYKMTNMISIIIYNSKELIILNASGIFNLVWGLTLDFTFALTKKLVTA